MTATLTPPDELTIVQLDEDWAVPCDVGRGVEPCPGCGRTHQPCGRQAAWVAWAVRCCSRRPASVLLCDEHRQALGNPTTYSVCGHCTTTFTPALKAFSTVEPLNG